jgi:exosortase A-associated hydrolase 2
LASFIKPVQPSRILSGSDHPAPLSQGTLEAGADREGLEAGFLESEQGALFYLRFHPRAGALRGSILYVHPFAEEMNKARRMAAAQARRFAAAGYAVLMPDLHGCGDSAGDFADATWEGWLDDLQFAVEWHIRSFGRPLILWGLRAGCLLIDELLKSRGLRAETVLYWQPVVNGELHLTQFLRLRMASSLLSTNKETTGELRSRLRAGESLEVAGYLLAPTLADRLAAARLEPPSADRVCWLEVGQGAAPTLPPASARVLEDWQRQGMPTFSSVVSGDPFWTTQEICEVPGLIEVTLGCLEGAR